MSIHGFRSIGRSSLIRTPIMPIAAADHIWQLRTAWNSQRIRLDEGATITGQPYGKKLDINGVNVSFHPAGHILGSAQVRVEYKGEVWVISGDYKLTPDATCAAFESVKCNYFITEATFGLPIYRWPPPEQVFGDIDDWWRRNQDRGKASVIFAYSLGKAQRVSNGIDSSIGPIFTHGAVERLTDVYRKAGVKMPATTYAGSVTNKKEFAGSLIVAPPSAQASTWLRRFGSISTGFASGWMMVRGPAVSVQLTAVLCSAITPIGLNCRRR